MGCCIQKEKDSHKIPLLETDGGATGKKKEEEVGEFRTITVENDAKVIANNDGQNKKTVEQWKAPLNNETMKSGNEPNNNNNNNHSNKKDNENHHKNADESVKKENEKEKEKEKEEQRKLQEKRQENSKPEMNDPLLEIKTQDSTPSVASSPSPTNKEDTKSVDVVVETKIETTPDTTLTDNKHGVNYVIKDPRLQEVRRQRSAETESKVQSIQDKQINITIKSVDQGFPLMQITDISWRLTVHALKQQIQKMSTDNVETGRQRLIHKGRVLRDDKRLCRLGVDNGDILLLVRSSKATTAPKNTLTVSKNRESTTTGPDMASPISEPALSPRNDNLQDLKLEWS